MKSVLTITFLFFTICTYSQDIIKTVSGEVINAKVLEINKEDIKYKKYNNLTGPVYILRKQEISTITYQNGETEIYNNTVSDDKVKPFNYSVDNFDAGLFNSMTRRNNKVFIVSDNENAIIHATNAIERWGYWITTQRRSNADFVLNFNVNFAGTEAYGNADFINPRTGKRIRSTIEVNTSVSRDFNVKRGLINTIVDEGIKPMFYK
jgi:hypothetical protein